MPPSCLLLSPATAASDYFLSHRVFFRPPNSHASPFPHRIRQNHFNLNRRPHPRPPFRRFFVVSNRSGGDEDFITKVLKENPSQVEPKYLVGGDRFVTLREKQNSSKDEIFRLKKLVKRLFWGGEERRDTNVKKGDSSNPVYLKDILREFKGNLYVPEEVFRETLSEEEQFERDLKELPMMCYEDFQKHLNADKIKLLTSRSMAGVSPQIGYRDFVVELKDIIEDKTLQKSRWAIRLTATQAREALEEYKGPQYEIEKHATSYVGKLPEYPHPVASSISSRMMVELGMVTALIAAAAALIAGFVGSAVFAVTSFVYAATIYVVWPLVKPFLKIALGIISNIVERIWENVVDIFSEGGIISKISEFYTFGGVSASLEMLKPIMLVFVTMVLLVRFTLSRRPKNFRKWDIWQGIEFGQSKPQARVDGSTGVKFSDVAGIDEAVEELQEWRLCDDRSPT